jgi:aminodeoxyfutalosine deaminase
VTWPASEAYAFRARWVLPVQSPPIRDGLVAIADSKIVYVGADRGDYRRTDLGDVAILPGLVNAHTHLEFSDLDAPLGQPGMPFTQWIATVVQHRRQQGGEDSPSVGAAIRRGIAESLRLGVTTLGEIATSPWPWDQISDQPVGGVVFRELLGFSSERIASQGSLARTHLQPGGWGDAWQAGLIPHSPYSVHPELLSQVVDLARRAAVPVAMHLAETREELQLLAAHDGPFVPLLQQLGAWDPDALPIGRRPMDYLKVLAQAPRALVIHGNYLADDEIRFLGDHADRLSVVFCPRTHRYFRHEPYPLARMISAGVRIALGTDSRSSSPDLSLLAEMRQVAADHSKIGPEKILRMATIEGARALGCDSTTGTLVAGRPADLIVVGLPAGQRDPYSWLFDASTPVLASVCRGRPVAGAFDGTADSPP